MRPSERIEENIFLLLQGTGAILYFSSGFNFELLPPARIKQAHLLQRQLTSCRFDVILHLLALLGGISYRSPPTRRAFVGPKHDTMSAVITFQSCACYRCAEGPEEFSCTCTEEILWPSKLALWTISWVKYVQRAYATIMVITLLRATKYVLKTILPCCGF